MLPDSAPSSSSARVPSVANSSLTFFQALRLVAAHRVDFRRLLGRFGAVHSVLVLWVSASAAIQATRRDAFVLVNPTLMFVSNPAVCMRFADWLMF
jgi:hypothetical protein